MIFYEEYDAPACEVAALLGRAELARLVTADASGRPHIGLYPFVVESGADGSVSAFELHLHRDDELLADLRDNPACVIECDELLSTIPSHWLDAENGVFATAYHRSVVCECRAVLADDAETLAAQQRRLMQRYQPEGHFRSPQPDDPMYRGVLCVLVGVRLSVTRLRSKFKLAQNRSPEQRRSIIRRLRERAHPGDEATAAALEATLNAR